MPKQTTARVVSRPVALDVEDVDSDRYVMLVTPPAPAESGAEYLLAGLLVGAMVGAAVGLFMAPRRGEETRRQLLSRLPGNLGEAADTWQDDAQAVVDTVADKVASAVPAPNQATPAALDPVAQVTQYQAPPERSTAPAPYTAETESPAPHPPS